MCTSCVNRKKMQPHSGRILVPVRRLSRKRLRTQRQPRTRPRPKSGEDESRPPRQQRSREWWSRRGKKSAFLWRLDTVSLGKHQRNGVEWQQGVTKTSQRNGAHVESARINKRGNPRRGFPLRPPPALIRAQGGSARCGGRPGAPPLHPAAFEKAGETFIRAQRGKFFF